MNSSPAPAPTASAVHEYPPPSAQPMHGYPPAQGYAPPMQQYAHHAQHPMQPYGHPGMQPMPPGYGQYPMQQAAPINIVVQNTNTNVAQAGGLVRVSNKSRGTAALLAFLLGGIGAHKFYVGQTFMGVLYLLTCWTFLPMVAGFFEGLGYLFSSSHDFDLKYNARLS